MGGTPTVRISLIRAVVDAQPAPRVRIGILSAGDVRGRPTIRVFIQRLGELGYVDGRNLTIDFRTADDKVDRLPDLAQELVRLRPDAILVTQTPAPAIAVMKATGTIPIVFVLAADPVGAGLVRSLSDPAAT